MTAALQNYFVGDPGRPFPNKQAADKNRDALLQANPWMAPEILGQAAAAVANENASLRAKTAKLIKLVDKAGSAIAAVSPCRRGCAHCCHIPTVIFSSEAERIGQHLGRPPVRLQARDPGKVRAEGERFLGKACPFLRNGECSIYEVRPFCCRAHHSLDDSPEQCDLSIPAQDSSVPSYTGVRVLELIYAGLLFKTDVIGDIREFFPPA